jgi:hypothetical protein
MQSILLPPAGTVTVSELPVVIATFVNDAVLPEKVPEPNLIALVESLAAVIALVAIPVPSLKLASLVPSIFHLAADGYLIERLQSQGHGFGQQSARIY